MRLSCGALGPLVFLAASCNFDAAFQRYCEGNPSCPRADAGAGPETAPDTPPDAPPDASPDISTGPDSSLGPPDSGFGRDLFGDGFPPLPPPPPTSCRQDNDCGANEVCHPVGNVCMLTCNTVDDCPPYLDTCAGITDQDGAPLGTRKVCQCQIADNCASYARNFTCNPFDNLCERMCRGNQECQIFDPQRVCSQGSGWCQRASGSCSSNRDCQPSQPRCDSVSLRCAGCVAASDCANRPDGLTQCGSTGACVPP